MMRDDLDASIREESACTKKRLATKLVPGPRERLRAPEEHNIEVRLPNKTGGSRVVPATSAASGPPGKRPRWMAPDRGPQL